MHISRIETKNRNALNHNGTERNATSQQSQSHRQTYTPPSTETSLQLKVVKRTDWCKWRECFVCFSVRRAAKHTVYCVVCCAELSWSGAVLCYGCGLVCYVVESAVHTMRVHIQYSAPRANEWKIISGQQHSSRRKYESEEKTKERKERKNKSENALPKHTQSTKAVAAEDRVTDEKKWQSCRGI